jgi:Domain of unknown function (DUF222)
MCTPTNEPGDPGDASASLPSSPFGGGAAAVMGDADRALTELAQTSWWAVGDGDLLRAVIEMETTRRKHEAARLALLAEVQARGVAVAAGAKSTVAWLVDKTRVGRGEATRAVQTATRLSRHAPNVREALAAGTISTAHAAVITAVVNQLFERSIRPDSPVTHEVRAAAQTTLLDLAETLDPGRSPSPGST